MTANHAPGAEAVAPAARTSDAAIRVAQTIVGDMAGSGPAARQCTGRDVARPTVVHPCADTVDEVGVVARPAWVDEAVVVLAAVAAASVVEECKWA